MPSTPAVSVGRFWRFTVPGKPQGKPRPRWNGDHIYQPETGPHSWRGVVAGAARQAKVPVVDGPVAVEVTIVRKLPASWSNAKRERTAGSFATATPDTVNVLAEVMDALEGIAYKNDAKVALCICRRVWGEDDTALVEIWAL